MINKLNTGAARAYKQYSQEQQDYLQRKLDHYNKWLSNTKRPFTESYPGFPEDKKLLKQLKDQEDTNML